MERGWREISPNCPRCGSSNTKFCYYNNYSLTQPRYFCKGCRRYWTKGGSLRNVPIGGGCRKSRRSRSSTLRLAASNPHHHHGLNASRSTSNTIFGHVSHNNDLRHNSYVSPSGDLTNMVDPTPSSMNPGQAPTIDLALVYANFLSPKPENSDSMVVEHPDDRSNTSNSQAMLQQERTNIVDCTNNPTFSSQGFPIMPPMSSELDHDQIFLPEFSGPVPLHHHHEEVSNREDLIELPPLPGESVSHEHSFVPWPPSTLNDHDHHLISQARPRVLPDLEPDSQLSNIFMGSWSPLDLPGFETSSSSSKP